MAKELLNAPSEDNVVDLTKADIFSLGISIYELIIMEELPCNGQEWHDIRNGQLVKLCENKSISMELKNLVSQMMNPDCLQRPSAEQILKSRYLQSEIENEMKWEKLLRLNLKKKIVELDTVLSLKPRKASK